MFSTFTAAAMLATALVLLPMAAAAPGRQIQPRIDRTVAPEKNRDARLEAAIRKYLDVSGDDARSLKYFYNRVDLNGDGKPEVLVYVSGQSVCGSGGCTALVLRDENGQYALLARITLVRPPLIVSRKLSHGWRDLILFVAGGGAPEGYAVLQFDGSHYPDNPSVPPAHKLEQRIAGTAYWSGAGARGAGLPLQPRESERQ